LKADHAKKNALDQLHVLRQEAEIQAEDLRSAEAETKKAWKIVGDANSKASAQAKELKEAQNAKLQIAAKATALQRTMDELNASTKLGSVEKSRLETEINTLQRRLRMEQELTKRAEADLATKSREVETSKSQDNEILRSKVATLLGQKEKLELAAREWQSKHADISSRLNQSESQKSRALLECEDLVFTLTDLANYRIMNLSDLNRLAMVPRGLP
jgi:chromosome segregation ATPase